MPAKRKSEVVENKRATRSSTSPKETAPRAPRKKVAVKKKVAPKKVRDEEMEDVVDKKSPKEESPPVRQTKKRKTKKSPNTTPTDDKPKSKPKKVAKKKEEVESESESDDDDESFQSAFPEEKKQGLSPKALMNAEFRHIDWRELDFVGLELGNEEAIYKEKWSFDRLNEELRSGRLSNQKYHLYMFMGAQPFQNEKEQVVNIPYIVVLDSPEPPSGKMALTSVQLSEEIIKDAKRFHMSWTPYIPRRKASAIKPPVQLIHLKNEGRKTLVSKMSEKTLYQISLLMPYELLPQIFEEKDLKTRQEEVQSVSFLYTGSDGKKVELNWDKSCMNTKIDIEVIIEDNGWPESEHPLILAALKEAFNNARAEVKKNYDRDDLALKSLKPHQLEGRRNLKIYKFYPSHPTINVLPHVSPFINRYYGKANFVIPDPENPADVAAETKKQANGNTSNNNNNKSKTKKNAKKSSDSNTTSTTTGGFSVPAGGFALPATTGGFSFGAPAATTDGAASTGGFSVPAGGFSFGAPAATNGTAASSGFTFADPMASQTTAFADTSSAGGFTFSADTAEKTNAAYFGKKEPTADEWKCACCEEINPNTSSSCRGCLTPKPKAK